jgi:addiction module HigA family antidote
MAAMQTPTLFEGFATEEFPAGRLPNIHPGKILEEEFLEPMHITPYRLSKATGLTQTHIGEIIKGKRSITATTALRLGAFFGTTPKFWLNLQASYDLEEEEGKLKDQLGQIRPFAAVTG